MNWRTICVLVACAAALVAQSPPVTILEIDVEGTVLYVDDVADRSKMATSPAPSNLGGTHVFKNNILIGDIVAVNGTPARGVFVLKQPPLLATTDLTPGRAVADVRGVCPTETYFSIQKADGTAVGSIMTVGFGGLPPPGAPSAATNYDNAVVGGTGAFLGVRGQHSRVRVANTRQASMVEDPAYRRINGGGTRREILHLIPMTWPEVMAIPTGPAIFHGDDFSPVTAEKPARAGELLMMSVSGLGPVKPNLDPGKPFPPLAEGKVYAVNSPVEVTVNGKAAQVINALGWPGMNNVYRVDFRVPEGTAAGTATLGPVSYTHLTLPTKRIV